MRANSTSTLRVAHTMARPDQEATIEAVCAILRSHMERPALGKTVARTRASTSDGAHRPSGIKSIPQAYLGAFDELIVADDGSKAATSLQPWIEFLPDGAREQTSFGNDKNSGAAMRERTSFEDEYAEEANDTFPLEKHFGGLDLGSLGSGRIPSLGRSVSVTSQSTILSESSAEYDSAFSGGGSTMRQAELRRLSSGGGSRLSRRRSSGRNRRKTAPTLTEMVAFFDLIYSTAQCSEECAIVSLAYVERVIANGVKLSHVNWRPLIMTGVLVASKVWDDLSMVNEDFSIFSPFSLRNINKWEAIFLSALNYNVQVSASQYAKYYFELRESVVSKGRAFPLKPLTIEEAYKLEVSSGKTERELKAIGSSSSSRNDPNFMLRRAKSDGTHAAMVSKRFVLS